MAGAAGALRVLRGQNRLLPCQGARPHVCEQEGALLVMAPFEPIRSRLPEDEGQPQGAADSEHISQPAKDLVQLCSRHTFSTAESMTSLTSEKCYHHRQYSRNGTYAALVDGISLPISEIELHPSESTTFSIASTRRSPPLNALFRHGQGDVRYASPYCHCLRLRLGFFAPRLKRVLAWRNIFDREVAFLVG